MGQTYEWRDMTKLAVAIRFAKSPKRRNDNKQLSRSSHQTLTMQAGTAFETLNIKSISTEGNAWENFTAYKSLWKLQILQRKHEQRK